MNYTREHMDSLEEQLYNLRSRHDELLTWCAANVRAAEWSDRMRDANILSTRINVLQERIINLLNGEPEMGTAPATNGPIHTATVRTTPK